MTEGDRGYFDLPELLDNLSSFIRRFVALSSVQADICAVWIVHTHAIDGRVLAVPRHQFPSATVWQNKIARRLKMLVFKQWFTGQVSSAALVRKIALEHPTLLLDESDTAFSFRDDYSEKLRGILNTGFQRGASYSVCVQNGNGLA